jgi:hypothetical protein
MVKHWKNICLKFCRWLSMNELKEASERLCKILQDKLWFNGGGIMTEDGISKIVVYVENMNNEIFQTIPKNFDGFEVCTRNHKTIWRK